MRTFKAVCMLLFILFIITTISLASDFKAEQPILITAAGQGPDATMVKILSQKAGLKFEFEKLAKSENLKNSATLIFVTGASAKGLGAANIDKEQEFARVQELIKAAKASHKKIITMHIGGPSRRGKLSDNFNAITAESADCLIILKNGNEDKYFTQLAAKKKIPVFEIDKKLDAVKVLKQIFLEEK